MDFGFSEEQQEIAQLAARIFSTSDEPWTALAGANLLGLAVPAEYGGSGLGFLEVCSLLEQQGRHVVSAPVLPTVVTAMAIADGADEATKQAWLPRVAAGEVVLTARFGADHVVPAAPLADAFLIDGRLYDKSAVTVAPVDTTDCQPAGTVEVTGDPVAAIATDQLVERATVGVCALQAGVCAQAVRIAADYTSNREQFGRPLSTNQGVALRAADAHIDTEAITVTMWRAAWRLHEGLEATAEVDVAKYWAAEAGYRVVHATQHLHGGIGADVSYPIHRYYLWGKQLAQTLGGAEAHLASLGRALTGGRN